MKEKTKEEIFKKFGIPFDAESRVYHPQPLVAHKFQVNIDNSEIISQSVKSFSLNQKENTEIKIIFYFDSKGELFKELRKLTNNKIVVKNHIGDNILFVIEPLEKFNINFSLDYSNPDVCYIEFSCSNVNIL